IVREADEVPARLLRLVHLRLRRGRRGALAVCRERRERWNPHPFKDNVNRVPDILAVVMPAPRAPVELRSLPRPDLPAGAALLRTERSEDCGTDVHLWHGRLAGVPYPIIPGHVSAGTIDAARGSLTGIDGAALREGDRAVFFDVHRTCGRCRACTVH